MSVAIIDYGSGNLRSAAKAFERAGSMTVQVTNDPAVAVRASHIVLPGVGAFADCMGGLTALPGMIEVLEQTVIAEGRPFLGICIGMHLMAGVGREHGAHPGLGWIPGDVVAVEPGDPSLKVPHMGWNDLRVITPHPVLDGLGTGCHVYFVHGYRFQCRDAAHVLADVDHGGPVAAAIGRDNLIGAQFHPEKSQAAGLRLIANFLAWRP